MHFKGEVVQTRDLADNTPVSYGRTYYTKGKQKIAVLSAGYGDGLPRNLSNKGKVLMQGKRVDVVGTVCMNMIMCDVSGLRDIVPGSEVVFLGTQGEETITGDDIATWTQTISYEIFCSIGVGTRKEYVG
jgi:alanine racemase